MLRRTGIVLLVLILAACNNAASGQPEDGESAAQEQAAQENNEAQVQEDNSGGEQTPATTAQVPPAAAEPEVVPTPEVAQTPEAVVQPVEQVAQVDPTTQADPTSQPVENPDAVDPSTLGFEGVREGRFVSERFNISFSMPEGWNILSTVSDDSMYIEGPDGIQMVLANAASTQLVNANFETLGDRASFESVNMLSDRTQIRPINGLPTYRVEGDALLRGENVPIYFVSQAVTMPDQPLMATIFIPGDNYMDHSDTIFAVLDSMEAISLLPQ